jgi:hypothetical protein
MAHGIGVGSFGRGGGLALLWTHDIGARLQTLDKLHIDVVVTKPDIGEDLWRFTWFYGESRRELRH